MATNLRLDATNSTSQGWHFALYQKQPSELGLKTIAWKVLSLSKPQPSSTSGSIPWSLNFEVTIPETNDGSVYVGGLSIAARDGYNYEAAMEDGYIQIKETGPGTPGYINFKNSTNSKQDLGLSLSGTLLSMQQGVAGGVSAQFQITPTYYVGLFTNIKQGAFVTSDAAVGPVTVKFPPGMAVASVNAIVQAGQDMLQGPTFSN